MADQLKDALNVPGKLDRRRFLGVAAGTAGAMLIKPSLVRGAEANSALRIGLLGCGGRGTDDATVFVNSANARIVALADLFQDQLDTARAHFDTLQQAKGYPALDPSQLFVGPNAYQEIAASKELDAVVIATPPYYHVQHLDAVVAAGKHVYVEKPVAVDVPGAKKVLEIGKRAEGKLSLDVGFQIRECPLFVEVVKRIQSGAIGEVACGEAHYFGGYISRPAWPNASPTERRLRNWIYDRTLSGDIIVEQNIHVIDVCNWVLQAHPLKASATGGRLARPEDGDVYGNYNVIYYYPGGIDVTFSSTQFSKGWSDMNERFFGTKGTSQSPYSGPLGIWGDEPWQPDPVIDPATGKPVSNLAQADPAKKLAFVESITSGNFHNQAAQGVETAITCMMAREAAYTGHDVTWEEINKSTEVYDPHIDLNNLS
ncbi:MAG TPA: Gfo/Idh/MocA family oxidoreductase [Candidatus Aquilonibacter sp.]|nr:Gfo/Idh/MocA family oxidoreductase [Candidatus Aquilonibacter sp.]